MNHIFPFHDYERNKGRYDYDILSVGYWEKAIVSGMACEQIFFLLGHYVLFLCFRS